jgi:hypothetical protein
MLLFVKAKPRDVGSHGGLGFSALRLQERFDHANLCVCA